MLKSRNRLAGGDMPGPKLTIRGLLAVLVHPI